jgi:hypothetical protein
MGFYNCSYDIEGMQVNSTSKYEKKNLKTTPNKLNSFDNSKKF